MGAARNLVIPQLGEFLRAHPRALTVNNTEAYMAACQAGLGIIQVPASAAAEQILAGTLVEILAQHRPAPMPVSLLYANRRHLPKRVQVFMTWLAEKIQPYLMPHPTPP